MQKLANSYKRKSSERRGSDAWRTLLTNILNSQRGRIPLLLAVESGNQSMVRELLSSQTAEQLRVCRQQCDLSSVFEFISLTSLFDNDDKRRHTECVT